VARQVCGFVGLHAWMQHGRDGHLGVVRCVDAQMLRVLPVFLRCCCWEDSVVTELQAACSGGGAVGVEDGGEAARQQRQLW